MAVSVSYNKCIEVPDVELQDLDIGSQKLCIELSNDTFTDGTRDCTTCASCGDDSTPRMASKGFSILSKDVEALGGDVTVTASIGFWVGFEPRPDDKFRFWIGNEDYKVCANSGEYNEGETPGLADLKDLGEDLIDQLPDGETFGVPNYVLGTLAILVIALLLAYLSPSAPAILALLAGA